MVSSDDVKHYVILSLSNIPVAFINHFSVYLKVIRIGRLNISVYDAFHNSQLPNVYTHVVETYDELLT